MSWRHHGLRHGEVGSPDPTFIKPDQLDPWIMDQIKITLLPTISHLLLPNFVSCGRACPSHMTQNLVTVGAKSWTAERFLVDPWSMDYADPSEETSLTNPTMHLPHTPQHTTLWKKYAYFYPSVLWDMGRCIVGFVRLLYFLDIWRTSLERIACRFDTVFFALRDPKPTCEISQKFAAS